MPKQQLSLSELYEEVWKSHGNGDFDLEERRLHLRGILYETTDSATRGNRMEIAWDEAQGDNDVDRKVFELALAEYAERTGRLEVCEPQLGQVAVIRACGRTQIMSELDLVADLIPVLRRGDLTGSR